MKHAYTPRKSPRASAVLSVIGCRLSGFALLPLLLLLPLKTKAQDPQFSQFYAAPLYLNPALTGNTFEDRAIINFRKQWAGTGPGFNTYAVSYDHNNAKLHSGIGGTVLRDVAGTNGLAFTHAALNYSYEAHIDHNHAIRAGLSLGYTLRDYDPSTLVFADQVIRDNAPTSIETHLIDRISYFDATFGAMYFSQNFWAGASFNHLNRPQQSLFNNGNTRLPIRTSIDVGYRFATDGKKLAQSHTRMTLAAHYKSQEHWDQFDLGAYVNHRQIVAGLWYRGLPVVKSYKPGYANDESIIAMIGYETDNQIHIVYSYDITVSWLTMRSGGAHEISIIYEWPKRGKNRKYHMVPCPKF